MLCHRRKEAGGRRSPDRVRKLHAAMTCACARTTGTGEHMPPVPPPPPPLDPLLKLEFLGEKLGCLRGSFPPLDRTVGGASFLLFVCSLRLLLTLGAHAQRYLVCLSVCMCVCVCLPLF